MTITKIQYQRSLRELHACGHHEVFHLVHAAMLREHPQAFERGPEIARQAAHLAVLELTDTPEGVRFFRGRAASLSFQEKIAVIHATEEGLGCLSPDCPPLRAMIQELFCEPFAQPIVRRRYFESLIMGCTAEDWETL